MDDSAPRLPRVTPRRALGLAIITLLLLSLLYFTSLSTSTPEPPWGVSEPTARKLTAGLMAWPGVSNTSSLSSLGWRADTSFALGHDSNSYWRALEQFASTFPVEMRADLTSSLKTYREGTGLPWDKVKTVWQTDKDSHTGKSKSVLSWSDEQIANEGWEAKFLTDTEASEYVSRLGGRIEYLYNSLPAGILRADLLRYLFLLASGGIYSDTDTKLLRPPSKWGAEVDVHRGAWLSDSSRERLDAGESVTSVLGPASVIVGVEADAGDRADWHDWWSRPLQIVQWTMAAAPYHPITLHAVLRVVHQTAVAADWSVDRWERYMKGEDVLKSTVLSEPRDGGPLGVVDWTGPGVWTDAVVAYLSHAYGVDWIDLRRLSRPLRIGDVVVLPVTGFSPGVGQFGAGENEDPQAMVWHLFRGSWKDSPAFNGDGIAAGAW